MINDFENGKCPTCDKSIRCNTWAEWKCKVHERRFAHNGPVECVDYKKRAKDFVEQKCRCDDCMRNEGLAAEELKL